MIVGQRPFHAYSPMVSSVKSIFSSRQEASLNDEDRDNCSTRSIRKSRKSLKFHDTTSILWIESTDDMSDEEISACYYSTRDFVCFREREKRMVRHFSGWGIMKGKRNDDLLGVETRLQRFHRRQRSKNAVFAVIFEQELRQEIALDEASPPEEEDDVLIARVYEQYTKESIRLARERAISNATQVERLYPSSSLYNNGYCTSNDMELEMEEKTEDVSVKSMSLKLPWEIPISRRTKPAQKRNADKIKFASFPILPHHYLQLSYPEQQWGEQDEEQDLRYESQPDFHDRASSNGSRRQEAPAQQRIMKSYQNFAFRRPTPIFDTRTKRQSSAIGASTEHRHGDTISTEWTWNSIYCDAVPPPNVSKYLYWDVY